jgi:hypothetical protein
MVIQVWLANRGRVKGYFAEGPWLVQALARLNACLGQRTNVNEDLIEALAGQLDQKSELVSCFAA